MVRRIFSGHIEARERVQMMLQGQYIANIK